MIIDFKRRFDPGYAAAKQQIEAGEIGRVERFRAVSGDLAPPSLAFIRTSGGMFVDMQKRLFDIIENQMADVPGVKQARAAMGMLPDLSQAQNLVKAMQGVMTSGGSAFESMQRVMSDFTRMAQDSMPGMKR